MSLTGTDGADSINGGYKDDGIDGGLGNDTLNGGAGNDTLDGGDGWDSLTGGSGDDSIYASGSTYETDTVIGGSGDDLVHWGGGFSQQVSGGEGTDVLTTVGATEASAFEAAYFSWDIEQFIGGDFADRVRAFNADMDVNFAGGGGDDSLLGGSGTNSLAGDAGNDTLQAGSGTGSTMAGGDGNDILMGYSSTHTTFDGGEGRDLVSISEPGYPGITVSLAHQDAWQAKGSVDLYLTGIEDLQGSGESDKFHGDDNSNWLSGGYGFDTLSGAGGDDVLVASGDSTTVNGGVGSDTLVLSQAGYGSYGLTIDLRDAGQLVHLDDYHDLTFTSIENVSGSGSNDTITGNDAANVLYGGNGSDMIDGGAGADVLHGDTEVTRLGTSLVDYTGYYNPDPQADTIVGGSGADQLYGEYGNDSLAGGSESDTLDGGAGRDVLSGGAGIDTFVFSSISDSSGTAEIGSPDLITDLTSHERIDLSAIDADTTTDGDQAFHLVSAFSAQAGEAVLSYDRADNVTHLLLDVNGDGAQDMIVDMSGYHLHFAGFVL